MNHPMLGKILPFVLIVGLLLVTLAPLDLPTFGERDFLKYWASTHLLITGGNPYDSVALRDLEHSLRPELIPKYDVVEVWNPPWLLLILSPLGLLPFDIAKVVWVFCNVFLISLALGIVWQWLASPSDHRGFAAALAAGFLYAETLSLIQMGQITTLVLLGMLITIGCLRSEPNLKRDVLAGAALLLTALKPHLVYLAVLLIFIGVIRSRRWGVFAGLAGAGVISVIIVWFIFPGWLTSYLSTLSRLPNMTIYTSTVGSLMSAVFGIEIFRFSAVLLLPLLPWLVRLTEKDWLTGINLALLLSLPLSTYGFSNDQVVLLPAIVQLVVWLRGRRLPSRTAWVVGAGMVIVYGLNLWVSSINGKPYYWLVWPPLALLGLYYPSWKAQKDGLARSAV